MKVIQIPKKSGGYRTIYVPSDSERKSYREFLPMLNKLASNNCKHAHGFIPGRSAVTAARLHIGRQYTICWDLKDFFDTVTKEMVEDLLIPYILKRLFIDGAPRQGLPTSPQVANLAAVSLDNAIANYIDNLCVYTRYADDLTISFDDEEYIPHLLRDIPKLCRLYGFVINEKKTRVQRAKAGNRVVCGVVVGNEPDKSWASRKVRRRLRAAKHQAGLPVRHRNKAKAQAKGLEEWCKQKLPVQEILEERTNRRGATLAAQLNVSERREKRYAVRKQMHEFPVKYYLRAVRFLGNHKSVEKDCAAGLVATFGADWQNWINGLEEQDLHDAVYWLPTDILPEDGLGKKLLLWRREIPDLLKTRRKDLGLIARNWSSFDTVTRKLPFSNLVKIAKSQKYGKVKSKVFAMEAAEHGVDSDNYKVWERRWLRANEQLLYDAIPRVSIQLGKYIAKVLDRTDPRALFAGEHTDCCQHPGGDGSGCAWHAVENPEGSILAIESDGEIVAQSWLWRSGDVIVADNCEALDGYDEVLVDIYEAWAEACLGKLSIKEVRIGKRGDLEIPKRWWQRTDALKAPSGCYSDSQKQVVIKIKR